MLEEKLKYWIDKYDKDVEAKQHELDILKVEFYYDWACIDIGNAKFASMLCSQLET